MPTLGTYCGHYAAWIGLGVFPDGSGPGATPGSKNGLPDTGLIHQLDHSGGTDMLIRLAMGINKVERLVSSRNSQAA